jgi:3-oxoacyl-[acyl-carrier protein] reductase
MTSALDRSGTGRVAIVAGGSRGAGLATVCRLAASGFAVVVNYLHDQRAAESAVESILADRGDAVAVRADIADELDVARLFAETAAVFGGIDVVVHAACGRPAVVVGREAARHVRDHGAIVTLGGAAGGAGSDAVVDGPTRTLARELRGRDIAVNAVSPGDGAAGAPEAADLVADVVAFLLSEPGHRLTGRVLRVGGPGLGS